MLDKTESESIYNVMRKKKINIAVVGAGQWGPNLIRNFHNHPDARVSLIVDSHRERLNLISEKYGDIRTTGELSELWSSSEVDAVVLATPTVTHFNLAKEALKRRKHVFVEKPLCTDPNEAAELVSLAREQHCRLMVGHVFLFHPGVRLIYQLLRQQELGEIYYLYSIRTNFGPIRYDVNALWDLASHDISIFLYLLEAFPTEMQARGESFINPGCEDVVFGHLRFDQRVVANFHVSWLDPKKVRQLVIVGSRKMLVFDDMVPISDCIKIYDKKVSAQSSSTPVADTLQSFRQSIFEGVVSVPKVEVTQPLMNECEHFIRAILSGEGPLSDGVFGLKVVQVLAQLQRTLEGGKEISIASGSDRSMLELGPTL